MSISQKYRICHVSTSEIFGCAYKLDKYIQESFLKSPRPAHSTCKLSSPQKLLPSPKKVYLTRKRGTQRCLVISPMKISPIKSIEPVMSLHQKCLEVSTSLTIHTKIKITQTSFPFSMHVVYSTKFLSITKKVQLSYSQERCKYGL